MIYRKIEPSKGKIFIDGAVHSFEMTGKEHAGYIEITAFYNDVPSGHKIPVNAELFKPFRTGGHQYKVTKQQVI